MNRVLVCGGRTYSDWSAVDAALDGLHTAIGIAAIIQGDAPGADAMAAAWASRNFISRWTFPANWNLHKRAAGPIRNEQMARVGKPHICVAFPGNVGTAGMMSIAAREGIPTWHPTEETLEDFLARQGAKT